jgi:hypothetical protein
MTLQVAQAKLESTIRELRAMSMEHGAAVRSRVWPGQGPSMPLILQAAGLLSFLFLLLERCISSVPVAYMYSTHVHTEEEC